MLMRNEICPKWHGYRKMSVTRRFGILSCAALHGDLLATQFVQSAFELAAENLLVGRGKACYVWAAFVALVTPLDSLKGLQVHTCGLFCFTAGGGREAQIA